MHPSVKAKFLAEIIEGGRRTAKPGVCHRCDQDVLVGEDHDTSAHVATVDLDHLTPVEEMVAIFNGRATYDLVPATGKTAARGTFHLYHRETWHMDDTKYPVLAEHRCPERR